MATRLSFEDEEHIRVINKGGLDAILNFKTGEIVTAASLDNF